MGSTSRISLVPRGGKGASLVQAYECLRVAAVVPLGYEFDHNTLISVRSSKLAKGMQALRAAGFEVTEFRQ